jgi:putative aminopeptidase FrvX
MLELITELTTAHSPVGNEREIDAVLRRHLDPLPCDVWQDSASNIIAKIAGAASDCPLILDAHKDELGLVIKRIEEDGKIRVATLGGTYPWKYGEGPMDILADVGTVPAVLCFGAMHTTEESPIHAVRSNGGRQLKWSDCYLDAKLSKSELLEQGVHPGCKVVVSRDRKQPIRIGDYVGTYALDDKGAVAVLLSLATLLADAPPPQDVYLVFSSTEENAGGGGPFAARTLPGDTYIALEIAPVAEEYDIVAGDAPVLVYKDGYNVYNEGLLRSLAALAKELEIDIQHAALESYGTNASIARKVAAIGRIAAVAFPCQNTHGFEVAHLDSLTNLTTLLLTFINRWPAILDEDAASPDA